MDRYNKLTSENAKKRVTNFLNLMQKNGVDPLGFGLRYEATHLHNRDIAREWKELYPNLKFDVSVKVSIKDVGTIE